MKKISILGSTGSIGTSTLDVVREHPEEFRVVALCCGKNLDLVLRQIEEFSPELVSVAEESDAVLLRQKVGSQVTVESGEQGALAVATHPEAAMVISAMVGAVGLLPTYAAIQAGKDIGLANKETMVIAGELMNQAARTQGVKILPVDSEHAAIFQCLQGEDALSVKRLILTASGGPFREHSAETLAQVTVEQALKHPNWSMGAKITIDSASLMNKGLELIEARWLFDVAPEKLSVQVHPQSIIHSMVEFCDGSVMAQLGIPDMRIPIAYALSYPRRLPNRLEPLNLTKVGTLTFSEPDEARFRCLSLAKAALRDAGTMPAVLNAANEIAVAEFLSRRIGFLQIAVLVEETLQAHDKRIPDSLESILEADRWARTHARRLAAA